MGSVEDGGLKMEGQRWWVERQSISYKWWEKAQYIVFWKKRVLPTLEDGNGYKNAKEERYIVIV
jgi:hypothetical protein